MSKLSTKFKSDSLDLRNLDASSGSDWRRPQPPYHITSLFMSGKSSDMQKKEFKGFKEDVYEEIAIKGVVVVEDFLICALAFPTCIPVENKCPHIT